MSGDGQRTPPGGDPEDGDRRPSSGADVAWSIVSYMLSGIIAWGGIGWLLDSWLGTSAFLPAGILVGFGGAFYLIIRRYGGT